MNITVTPATRTIPQIGAINRFNCIDLLDSFLDNENVFNANYRLYASENTVNLYKQLLEHHHIDSKLKPGKFRVEAKLGNNTLALYDVKNEELVCITE